MNNATDRDISAGFDSHTRTLRGRLRQELVYRQLTDHLSMPVRIADVGGGTGEQALRLAALGHHVTIIDPSSEMLEIAERRIGAAGTLTGSIRLIQSVGEEVHMVLPDADFDAVLCHGVIMYQADPRPLLRALIRLGRPGTVLSIVTKNAAALAMRPGLEGRYDDALKALRSDRDLGRLGLVTRGDTVEGLEGLLSHLRVKLEAWYGIRVFTDHLGDEEGEEITFPSILAAEMIAGRMDPYRRIARLIHIVGVISGEG